MQTEHMRPPTHARPKREEEAIGGNATASHSAAEIGSRDLRRALEAAINRQAARWGIRPDQAQALLLDRKVIQ